MSFETPKLYYFSIRGFAEYIRLLFIDQGVKFNDIRFQYNGAEWAELKRIMTFGQVPCLKIDGLTLVQTGAIMRYLGRKYDLNGSTEQERTFLDMCFEGIRDTRTKYQHYVYREVESKEQCVTKTIPESLENLEKLFELHPGDFILGNRVSYTDYILFEELDVYNCVDEGILLKFPVLKKFWERMWARDNLKEYLEKRKKDGVWFNLIDKI